MTDGAPPRAQDGWTPGQHALLRAAAGLYLTIALLLAAGGASALWILAGVAALLITGWFEAWVAGLLAAGLALAGLQPADPYVLMLGIALLLRALRAPLVFNWLLIAACLAWSGFIHWQAGNLKLASAEALFLILVLTRSAQPLVWCSLLIAEIALIVLGRGMLLNAAPIFLLLCAFDPAWIRPRRLDLPLTVFFDGTCGFCHRGVTFLLREDRDGSALRYAPLQGATFARLVPEAQRAGLPDSIVVREPAGGLHVRSAGALLIGGALGGLWRPLAAVVRLVPSPLRDAVYDGVARVRSRLFRKPEGLCPILPPQWLSRFDAD